MGHSKSSSKREIHNNIGLHQEARKIPQAQSTFYPKGAREEQQTKPKVSKRKEIIKIRAEINERESNKIKVKSMKPRAGSLKK